MTAPPPSPPLPNLLCPTYMQDQLIADIGRWLNVTKSKQGNPTCRVKKNPENVSPVLSDRVGVFKDIFASA